MINLTQHVATSEQVADGVFEPADKRIVQNLLTFTTIPSREEVRLAADSLADIALNSGADAALVGGAPFLMGVLEQSLRQRGIRPAYAFSMRESVEKTLPDGSVQKINVFKHVGFYWA
jgi:hypothetical protein